MNALQGIGGVLLICGIVAFIWGIINKLRVGRVSGAPLVKTGDAARQGMAIAGERGAVSVEGAVRCEQPLRSPVTGTPCLFYELRVTKSWKDGETEKTKELTHDKRAAAFTVDDGSGPVAIDATQGGDFEPVETKRESKGTGLMAGLTGGEVVFGAYKVEAGMLTLGSGLKFHVEERVLPVVPKLYVCGKAGDGGGSIGSPSWRQLILSNKSRDEILGAAAKAAKIFLPAGAGTTLAGVGLTVVAALVAGGSSDASPTPKNAARTTAATTTAAPSTPSTATAAVPSATAAAPSATTVPAAAKGAPSASTAPPSTTPATAAAAAAKGAPSASAAARKK
jgi:hypothetical protein